MVMVTLVFLPSAAMTWYKDSRPLTSAAGVSILNRGQVLEIDRAQVSDAGLYKCVAVNVAGTAELTLSLQVYGGYEMGLGVDKKPALYMDCAAHTVFTSSSHGSLLPFQCHPLSPVKVAW